MEKVPSSTETTSMKEFPKGYHIENFVIRKTLGRGTYGTVYEVERVNSTPNTTTFALKTISFDAPIHEFKNEVNVLKALLASGSKFCCSVIETGKHLGLSYFVMSRLGQTLQQLLQSTYILKKTRRFTLPCALRIGKECLEAIHDLHKTGYIHGDIKPSNFAVGYTDPKRIYIFDFGMSKKFQHFKSSKHLFRWSVGFRGTASYVSFSNTSSNEVGFFRYASLDAHKHLALSVKDDLESWLYQQIELTSGRLPWKKLKEIKEIQNYKKKCRNEYISTLFRDCPSEYSLILKYIDDLKYTDTPNYTNLQNILNESMQKAGCKPSDVYDWEKAVPFSDIKTQTQTK